ncbi:ABC transporter substrate-binding protein [Actinophytocola sp.]|uniref:ABC transporter substrate-binding protein n=1 Tax=Actinophytocola sp. TaxID=1872138 RepID=UPI003D6C1AE2
MRSVAAVLALTMFVAGCASSSGGEGGGGSEGVTSSQILLGTSNPLTGAAGGACKPISDAAWAWFEKVNADGGVNGRKIKNEVLDDQYDATQALANARQFVRDKVFAFFGGCGTIQPPAMLPVAQQSNTLLLFPYAGLPALFTEKNVFNLLPLYGDQHAAAIGYAFGEQGKGSVYSVVQQADGQQETIDGIKNAATEGGGTYAGGSLVTVNERDFNSLALKIKQARPDYISMQVSAGPAAQLITAMVQQDALPTKSLLGTSVLAASSFLDAIPKSVHSKLIVANPTVASTSPHAAECVAAVKEYSPDTPIDVFSMWGCATAQVFVAGLEEAGNDVTRDSFAKVLEGWKNKDASPMIPPVTFTETNHLGNTAVTLITIKDGQPTVVGTVQLSS